MKEVLLNDSRSTDNSVQQKRSITFLTIFRWILGIIIIVIGFIVGIYLSTLLMMITAGSSNNRFLGFFVEFLIFLIIVSALTFLGIFTTSFCSQSKRKQLLFSLIIMIIIYILTLTLFLIFFYIPVSEAIEYTNEPSGYWELPTGSKIAYYEYGLNITQDYPFLLVHGGPGAPVLGKEHFVDELISLGFRVFQFDQLGCGKSSRLNKVNEYSLNRQIEDLEWIRKTIGSEKINIICHSFGGSLSSNYITRYPNRVSQCIFISPGNICSSDHSIPSLTESGSIDQRKSLLKNVRFSIVQLMTIAFSPQGLFVMMSEKSLDNIFMKFHDTLNMMPGSGKFYNTKGSGFGFWANVMTGQNMAKLNCQYEALKKFEGKSLVIKSQFDYISFDVTAQFRDLIPNSILITIDGMGHSVDNVHQKEIWENIEAFVLNGTTIKEPYEGDVYPW